MSPMPEKILQNFIPKNDIQQQIFLQKYPKYDGRGVLIAIIDTGTDVSLDGLQKTSTGLPKIIGCFDFSGRGDVDTSMVRKSQKNNTLLLLSGKEISIPQNWENPSNKWHLGIKRWKEMDPLMINEKDITWTITKEVKYFKENESKTENLKKNVEKFNFISELLKKDSIDCIVWNDGKKWCTCIVSPSTKNLENEKVLTNFRDEHEYCCIFENICCCVTIKNDGNLLELFIPYSEHGSYVTQVAAAHYPGEPEKDGLAPGAQIVSINISTWLNDNKNICRGITKAFKKCIELGVDVINISTSINEFVESDYSAIIKLVNERGIIMTQSAGNLGPFISSLRHDTNNSNDEMFTIGSLFTSDMKTLVKKEDDNSPAYLYYSSSKGPLPNGARGVTFVAPGGSIVENPRWHPSKKRIFFGTSCASPIAAGAIACLISALKANSIKYTPASINIALSNTAFLPNGKDQLGFGNGIIKINSAFEYLKAFKMDLLQNILLLKMSITKSNNKGIVFYKLSNVYKKHFCIKVKTDQKEIQWIFKLAPEENQKHIEYSKTITNSLFHVKLDTKEMKPGSLYYSEIHAFNPTNLLLGPIFHFPITVIVPEKPINNYIEKEICVKPPSLFNFFIDPIKSCGKCTVMLQDQNDAKVLFRTTVKKSDYKNIHKIYYERKNEFTFRPNGSGSLWIIKIRWQKVFEICIYQKIFVKSNSDFKFGLQIYFEE